MSVVGIDFGTEFSKVAVAHRQKISMVPNELSKLSTPSLIAFSENERSFGDMALSQWSRNYQNTVPQIKRLLGRQSNDSMISQELSDFCLCETGTMDDGRIGLNLNSYQGKHLFAPEQVMAGYFTKLKEFTSRYLEGLPVKDVVIGCPSYFDDAQRRALLTAASLAQLNVLRLMNETTAIALNYGILRQLPQNETRRVVFVDVGVGNTQVAVVDFVHGKLSTTYTSANPFAGGRNYDKALFDHFAAEWEKQSGLSVLKSQRATLRLRREVTRVKKMLSGNKDAVLPLDCFMDDKDFTLRIDRATLEQLVTGTTKGISEPIIEALQALKDDKIKIHSVEIVGGPSKIPSVQNAVLSTVQKYEPDIKQLSFTLNHDESVARGCALMCAMISPNFKVREFQVQDINTWPVTIEYPSKDGGMTEQLVIKRGNPSPCTAKVTFHKNESFDFVLRHPKSVKINDESTLLVSYPFLTKLDIGNFKLGAVKASENLVSDPKIKLMISLNRHGILDVPQATLIEYVKREEPPAPVVEDPKKDEPKTENTNNDQKNDNENQNATENDKKPKPMEVDEDNDSKEKPTSMETDDDANENKTNDTEMTDKNNKDKDKESDNSDKSDENNENNEDTDNTNKTSSPEKPAIKPKRTKKKVTRALPVTGYFVNGISNDLFNKWHELEAQLCMQDRVVVETAEKRNELETYIYDMRDKLDMSHRDFINEEAREKFNSLLTNLEDWLYDEGEHAQKSQYTSKLTELKSYGDPIEIRYNEAQNRNNRVTQLKKLIFKYQKFVTTEDEKYNHITEDDRKKVKDTADKCDQWLTDKMIHQDKLNKWDNPVVYCKEIDHQYRELMNTCNPVVTKPKPVPKKEDKKPEEKPDANKENGDKTGQESEQNGNATQKDQTNNENANNDNNTNENTNKEDADTNMNNNTATTDKPQKPADSKPTDMEVD